MSNKLACRSLVLVILLSAFACERDKQQPLYNRLGGEPGITTLVNDFIDRFRNTEDERIKNPLVTKRHESAYIPALKEHWVRFISQSTGGADKYEGRNMKWAHAGLAITDEQFDRTIEIMAESLAASKIGKPEQEELLELMRKHRDTIVERR